MNEIISGLLSAIVGSLVGGVISWQVALVAVKSQIKSTELLEAKRQFRELLLRFLSEIDEYIHYSFRPQENNEEMRMKRQHSARVMLTTAFIITAQEKLEKQKLDSLAKWVVNVDNWHYDNIKNKDVTYKNKDVTYSNLKKFLDDLKNKLCSDEFGINAPSMILPN